MKNVFSVIILLFVFINAQTAKQIKQQLQNAGITPETAKQIAKDQGLTEQQIEAETQMRGINLDETGNRLMMEPPIIDQEPQVDLDETVLDPLTIDDEKED